MATSTGLTSEQFARQYGNLPFEFWYGEAVPKSMPTWIHGVLQAIICQLLGEVGFFAASEVELRVDPEAHPRPDISAVSKPPTEQYPTRGVDVVVEILSKDDGLVHLKEKFRKYQEWGCGRIYLVDPADRSIAEWRDGDLLKCLDLVGILESRIWSELNEKFGKSSSFVNADDFRRLALSLPGAVENSHMNHPDFRANGKIFATLRYPDDGWGVVKLPVEKQNDFVRAQPDVFVPAKGAWGRQGCTNVRLEAAEESTLREALSLARHHTAVKPSAKRKPIAGR